MKTNFRKYFTPLCVFSTNWKYGQTKNILHFDRKIPPLTCKINFIVVLPSRNILQTKKVERERERERERESRHHSHRWKLISAAIQIVTTQNRSCSRPTQDRARSRHTDLVLPLAQRRWSGHHRPPAHSTPPPNPPDLVAAVLHPLWSLSFPIYLSFPQSVTLSPYDLTLSSSCSIFLFSFLVGLKCIFWNFLI